jgi:nickel/cobalt transporter (NicO) family protein
LFEQLVQIQRDIYTALAGDIKQFAANGLWLPLLAVLPMGVVFGAVHALTPGHSKTVLATYLSATRHSFARGLLTSLALSFTHVSMSVLIAVLSLPLVSVALGSVGRAPVLEDISRGLLGLIGLWMIWRALRARPHDHAREGQVLGVFAGLIPCPLTLFVMTFAISRGVPEAGLLFALAMMIGVAITLAVVALLAVAFNRQTARLLASRPHLLMTASRVLEGVAGLVLLALAVREIVYR